MTSEWKLVPIEPTGEMRYSGATAMHTSGNAEKVYDAMLATAPQPPALNECGACGGCEGPCRLNAESPPALGGELEVIYQLKTIP